MKNRKLSRYCQRLALFVLLLPLVAAAQTNEILILLQEQTYDCATGQATVKVHIINRDPLGNANGYNTTYDIHLGSSSQIVGRYLPNGNDDVEFTGAYTPGQDIVITAAGVNNNNAPQVEYRFVGITPGSPAPTISTTATMPLCNGASATLTASGGSGMYIWSNGVTSQSSITVNTPGTYTVRVAGSCGLSAPSNAIVVTAGVALAAPTVSPSGNQQLCNGESVTLSATGTDVMWSNGATGNSITVNTAGTYYAYDRNVCGNSANSNAVTITTVVCPTPLPGSSFFVCPGALKTLDAGAGYDTYEWSNGATTQTIAVGPGTYSVTVSRQGCFASSAPVTVGYYSVTTPTITPSGATTFCAGGSVTLTASAGISYNWSNGANTNSITASAAGTYYVSVTDANGCTATSAAINVNLHPLSVAVAVIAGSTSVCQNGGSPVVSFIGSGGTAPYTFTYTINGGSNQTITTTSGNSVTVAAPTNTAGAYTYSLVSVSDANCSAPVSGMATITVNALPTATISGDAAVCRNATAPIVTFTGAGGVAPYTFSYKINNGELQTITTVSGNSTSVSVPKDAAGSFVYTLVGVQEGNGCVNAASGAATVVVNPLPTASISGNAVVCQNAASPIITFTGANGTAPYSFSYRVNSGSVQTVSGSTLSVPTNTAGSFTYTLISVSDANCSNAASDNVTIVVNPQAVKAIISTVQSHLCNGETGTIKVSNYVSGNSYVWYKDGVLFTTTTNDAVQVTLAGSYTVVSVSPNGCAAATASNAVIITTGSVPTPIITGSLKVCDGGRTLLAAVNAPYDKWRWSKPPLYDKALGEDSSFFLKPGSIS